MAKILSTKSYYYNDVNLIAQPAKINSRSEIPKELNRIIVSPMESVVGEDFAVAASDLGLTVCLHRFCKPEIEAKAYEVLKNKENVFVSIGLKEWDRVSVLMNTGAKNWLIDVANGYIPDIRNTIDRLIDVVKPKKVMIGNIMTKEGVKLYKEYGRFFNGEFYIRTGISGGTACSTSDMTGFNRGNITEILECSEEADSYNIKIVADGGIKNGNYAAKAFGAGADACMLGGYFSKATEAYTHVIGNGHYWGGASTLQQKRFGGVRKHSEGKVIKIDEQPKPLKELVDDLWGGLSSAVSYSGYKSLTEFIGNGVFEIKQNSLPPRGR